MNGAIEAQLVRYKSGKKSNYVMIVRIRAQIHYIRESIFVFLALAARLRTQWWNLEASAALNPKRQ